MDKEEVAIQCSALVAAPVENWFTERNLERLVHIREYRDLWMQVYMLAKRARIETELVSILDEVENAKRMRPVLHWQDLEDLPPDPWIVEGLIRKAGLSIMAGDPKAGKSTLLGALVACILRGSGFIDREAYGTKVLYYALEEIGAEVKARFAPYLDGPEELMVREGYVPASQFIRILTEDIKEHQPGFVLIDPLFDTFEVESANDYVPLNRAMKNLLYVARSTGVHVCAIHHAAKAGGILGSQALAAGTDLNMYMKREDDDTRVLHSETRVGEPLEKYYCRMTKDKRLVFEPHL